MPCAFRNRMSQPCMLLFYMGSTRRQFHCWRGPSQSVRRSLVATTHPRSPLRTTWKLSDKRHLLWGGEGTCSTTDNSTVEDSCLCDPGYASRDSFGRPSCVPIQALVTMYALLALFEATACIFCLWHLAQHWKMPSTTGVSRKAVSRLRLVV
ncbi:unnamed protein product, partial [Ectocarpus sp. 12 AP-2014]